MRDDVLYIHMKEPCVTVLGPGKRFVVWTQGCDRHCPGCTAPEAQDMHSGEEISVDALATEIALSGADGLTISGGEPFLQPLALARMIDLIRSKRDMGVIVYTGFVLAELLEMPEAKELLNRIDLLIDGPYVRELDDGLSLRGSSNQRVLPLTRRYLKDLNRYGQPNRPVETFRHGAEVHFVGVADHQKSMNIAAQMRRYMESNPSVRLYMGGTGPVRNIPLKRIPIQSNEERMKELLEYMEKHTEPKKGE